MTSKLPDDNTEIEDETLHKKRARRVSFAETTAVHFFNRDEECETTPPNDVKDDQNSNNGKLSRSESDEILELLRSSSSSDDESNGGDDDVDAILKSSFLCPMESPSSGSRFGSATSNNEDDFFGVVSADFIRPGRLSSDSALLDDNHEVTMDSTAFSMNFRSLLRSDSGGEFITPTGVRVPLGERTTGPASTASSHGNSMVLTRTRNPVSHSSLPVDKVNDSGNSDDMSLEVVNRRMYDYGELPPDLNVLLAGGNKDVGGVSHYGDIKCSNSMSDINTEKSHTLGGREFFNLIDDKDAVSGHTTDLPKTTDEAIFVNDVNFDKENDAVADASLGVSTQNHSNGVDDDPGPVTPSSNHNQASFFQIHDIPYEKDKGGISSEAVKMFESPPSITQSKLLHGLPMAGSISSILSRRRKIFKNTNELPQGDKEFHLKRNNSRGWSTSVFAKSVSRLKKLETSFHSDSKVDGKASRLRPMETDKRLKYGSEDISFIRVDVPVACLDVRFAESDVSFKTVRDSDNYGLQNAEIVEHPSWVDVDKDEEFSGLHKSSPSKSLMISSSTAALETGLVNSQSKDNHESELEPHAIKTLQSMKSYSSLQDVTFSDLKDNSNAGRTGEFACSPGSGVINKVSASPLDKGSPFMLNLNEKGQKEADDLTSTVKNYSSLLVEEKDNSKLSSHGINYVEDVLQERLMLKNQLRSPVKSASIEISPKDKALESGNVISSNDDFETGRTLTSSSVGLPNHKLHSSPGSTLSPDARPNELPVQVLENPKEEINRKMLPKETDNLRDHAKMIISEGQDGATLHKLMGKYNEDAQLLQKSSNIYDSNGPSSHKRKLFDETEDHNDHAMPLLRKPKLCKDQKNSEEELKVSHCIESDSTLRDWNDVFTSFCGVTKQLLTPMSDKLDVALIAKLDDILVHLDKLKSFELLHHEIALDSARFLDSKRVVNTKLLLYKTVCQKAKLQLMHLKRDKLADQACRMKSRVDESERLMSNCYLLSKQGEVDQIDCSQLECPSADTDNRSLVSAEISTLRKELENSNGEIRKLNKSFYSRIKDKKELTSIETAASVKGLLKKMLACESLQSEMQLSKVERLHAMNGQPNILFDHGGFMLQSFIMKPTASSGLLVTHKLNNEKISKMYINDIDAYTAFSFVLSGDMQLKYDSVKTIAEQTQKTVSLLHTLLDVVGEVQLAMIDLRSLTWSRFYKPSAGQLDLQLCFTDFKSGARVNLSIDITCLNRGLYPSQVLPYEVTGTTARNHDVFESLLADIQTAVRRVRCGFLRILHICRCVARMVQDIKLVE